MLKKYIKNYNTKKRNKENKKQKIKNKIDNNKEKINKLIDKNSRLQDKKQKIGYVSWMDEIIRPLSSDIANKLNMEYKVVGNFGLRSEVPIWFCKNGNFDLKENQENILSITLTPRNLKEGIIEYDTKKQKNRYDKGTIGDMNGMNNVTKVLPEDLNEIVKVIKDINNYKEVKTNE